MSLQERLINGELDLAICSLIRPWKYNEKIKTPEDWASHLVLSDKYLTISREMLLEMFETMKFNIIQCPDTFLRQVRQGGYNHVLGKTRAIQIGLEV